jgi:hypothetical protein
MANYMNDGIIDMLTITKGFTMKLSFLLFLLLISSLIHAQDKISGMTSMNIEITPEQLEQLEAEGKVEIVEVRLRHENESFEEYADYVYGVAGFDLHMLPTAGFFGIGLSDPRGIVAAEGRLKLSILGIYGGERNNAIGAGVQGYLSPLKIVSNDGKLYEGIYLSAGYDKYTSMNPNPNYSTLTSSANLELGYDLGNARIGLGRDKMKFSEPDKSTSSLNGFLLKFSFKLSSPQKK